MQAQLSSAVGWLLSAAVLLPLGTSGLLALVRRRVERLVAAGVACAAVALSFVGVVAALWAYLHGRVGAVSWVQLWSSGAGGPAIGIGLRGDGLGLWFALIVTGVGLLIHVYSVGYMWDDPGFVRYFSHLNYFIFAMLLLVLADSLPGMLVGWANVGLASFLLIGFWHHRPDARAASMKAFLVTLTGEVGIVLAMALLWAGTGTLRFEELFARLERLSPASLTAAGLLLLWGAAAKSAQLPLHVWLPDAMAGPTPVSALIHAATMVTAGVYLTARMHPLYALAPAASAAVAWVGALSCLVGAVLACGQTDIKRVLAYSTRSQIGYMLLGVGVAAQAAGVFHFFTQAFFKALLFLAAGLVIHHLHGEQDLTRMGGLARALPLAYGASWAGALAMAGIPPFAGYFSKELILEAAWLNGHRLLWAVGALAAALTGFYSFRLLALAFLGQAAGRAAGLPVPHGGHAGAHADSVVVRRSMELPVAVLAGLALAGGWVWIPGRTGWALDVLGPVFGLNGAHKTAIPAAAHGPVGAQAAHGLPVAVAWLPVVLAGLGALAGLYLYGPGRSRWGQRLAAPAWMQRAWAEGLYVDRLYRSVLVAGVVRLAGWLERVVETAWIDGSVRGVAALAALLSAVLGRLQVGPLRRYALGLVAGSAAVVGWVVLQAWSGR